VRYRTRSADLPELGVDPGNGLMWGVRVRGRTLWLRGAPWKTRQEYAREDSTVIRTYAECADPPLTVTQEIFVDSARDVLLSRIQVRGAEETPAIYWFANFSPCTRVLPELPLADWVLDGINDFAVFTPDNGKTIHHFRPRDPGAREWSEAENLAAGIAAGAEVPPFEDGVWIATTSPNEVAAFQCGLDGDANSGLVQAEAGTLEGKPGAVGQCHSVVALSPRLDSGTYTAAVFIAFGKNKAQAEEVLGYATERGYDALIEETEAAWKKRIEAARLPSAAKPELLASCRRDLLTIIQCMDRDTGAVVRSPVVQPPFALDWLWAGVWITLALDEAGYPDLAEAHTLFYSGVSRKEGKRAMPFGSFPAASYANGEEGVPHLVLDTDAVAWVLASFWRHAGYLEDPARLNYMNKVWDTVSRGGDFLANWVDGRNREPLHSFDLQTLCDRRSAALLLTHFMGIDSAIKIADTLAQEVPTAWRKYKTDLEIRIRLRIAEGLLKPSSATRSRTADEILSGSALLRKALPGPYNDLLPAIGAAPSPFPDALQAALNFVAASEIYAQPRP